MNVVVVSGGKPAPWFAVHTLFERFPQTRWVRPIWTDDPTRPPARSFFGKISTAGSWGNAAQGYLLRRVLEKRDRQIAEMLDGPIVVSPALEVPIWKINRPEITQAIAAWKPDIVVTAGAPILKQPWFSMATFGAVNIHFGIAPTYRGEHTLFFARQRNDAGGIGMTIHQIDAGIDTGPIYWRGYPELEGGEGEAELWVKGARLVARVLPELVGRIARAELHARRQEEQGRVYRYRDRRISSELRSWISPAKLTTRPEWMEPEVLAVTSPTS